MAMQAGNSGDEQAPLNNINTTPLVDVMLVLLIIFLITIPVINKTVKVELPKAVNIPTQTKPENITVAIDKDNNIYWNDKRMPNQGDLLANIKSAAVIKPQPEVHIRADANSKFEAVGKVLYAIQRGGIVKVGFLTEPDHGLGR